MPRGSEELTNARRDEIISACAALYETMGFRDITIRDIGEKTSFTRTSIYNYFQTKEEIFLALLQREYERWREDLDLERRTRMLKLMSMNLYDMEGNSRMENLVDFKRAYRDALAAVEQCLEKFFPAMGPRDRKEFLYALFPFLFGVYPYTQATEKQKAAMEAVGFAYPRYTIYDITEPLAEKLLRPFQAG